MPVLSDFADLLPGELTWSGRATPEILAKLPNGGAVLLLGGEDESAIQALTTQQLRRLLITRLCQPEEGDVGPRADLGAIARRVRWRETHSPFESRRIHHLLMRRIDPRGYRRQIGFGPAWFLTVRQDAALPEIRVSERAWRDSGKFAGPWPTQRAAQAALETLWNLFDLCRYPEQIRRAPHGQRCAYFDMGRCDAPCDGSAAADAYVQRTQAAWRFLLGDDPDYFERTEVAMRAAARAQHFERAALLKQQLEAARRAADEWRGRVRSLRDWSILLLVPATRRKACKPFLYRRGALADGPLLPLRGLEKGLLEWAPTAWATTDPELTSGDLRMEQTWLLAHYLGHREADAAAMLHGGDAGFSEATLRELAARATGMDATSNV